MSAESEEKSYKKIEEILKRISLLKEADAKFAEIELQKLIDKTASTAEYEALLSSINDDLDYASSTAKILSNSFRDSVNELKKGREYLNLQVSSLRKLTSISDQLQQVRKGEVVFDQKKVEKLKAQQKLYISHLNTVKEQGGLKGKALEALEDEIRLANELDDTFKEVLETNEKINKKLGAIPQVAGGIDKALQKLGLPNLGIKDAIDETYKLGQVAAREGDTGFKPMSVLTAKIGSNIKGMITPANIIQASIGAMTSALIKGDKATGDLAKSMGVSYSEANKTRAELTGIAASSLDAAVNTRGLQETLMHVGSQLGSNAKLNSADLVMYTKLREQAGYTNEELYGVQQLSLVNGKSLEKNTNEILGGARAYSMRNKLMLNEKQILKDVSSASASLKLSLGGSADKLAEAAAKARQFGVSLQQAEAISSSLLNFESSIESELSAELLTGKDLNFERARGLALNGQTADAAAEILKQVGGTKDFMKMNVIQQEAMAKAAGMTKDQLAQSLMDSEAMSKLAGVDGDTAKEKFDNLVKEVGLTEAKKRLGEGALADNLASASIQDRFNQSVEKLQEIFISLSEPVLAFISPIMDMISTINGWTGGGLGTILKYLTGMYVVIKGIQTVTKGITALNTLIIGQKQTEISQNATQVAAEGTKLTLGQSILTTLGLQTATSRYQVAMANEMGVAASLRAAMEGNILGRLVLQGLSLGKNLIKSIALTLQSGYRMVSESIILGDLAAQGAALIKNLVKGALVLAQTIARAVAESIAAGAVSFGVGAAIGLAAGAAAMAYLSTMKDGQIDYKKGPIVSGEFGSVQLDKNDTGFFDKNGIKAGTDLLGEKTYSGKDKIGEVKKISQTKENNRQSQQYTQAFAELKDFQSKQTERPVIVHSVVKTENNDVLAQGTNSANRKGYKLQ
jgi:hypothetical protein